MEQTLIKGEISPQIKSERARLVGNKEQILEIWKDLLCDVCRCCVLYANDYD